MMRPRGLLWLLLGLGLGSMDVAAGKDMRPLPDSNYDKHIVFDASIAADSYFDSGGFSVAPSSVELVDGRAPLDSIHFVTPPSSLRMRWISSYGGDWQLRVHAPARYGLRNSFVGDTLSLWVYAPFGLSYADSPYLYLDDTNGEGTTSIRLVSEGHSLPAATWVHATLPISGFRAPKSGTERSNFDLSHLADVVFRQCLDDGKEHTLFIDDIQVYQSNVEATTSLLPPHGLSVRAFERHFELSWTVGDAPDLLRYKIYRSFDGVTYVPVGIQESNVSRYTDFIGQTNRKVFYKISAISSLGAESPMSAAVSGTTRDFSDDELLTMVQEACFRYYWEGAHPVSGMALEIIPGDKNLVAVGGTGFGIMALLVGADRGFITRDQCAQRILKILRFLKTADRFHGAWSHFLDGRTGRAIPYFGTYDDGGDLVETSFLVQGLLAARGYFSGPGSSEAEIRSTVTQLWQGVEWDWYRQTPDSAYLYWHWSPDYGWKINHPLIGWNETLMAYLLAIASPTHPVPSSLYYSGWASQSAEAVDYRQRWSRTTAGDHFTNGNSYYGITLDVGEGRGAGLFFTQFSFLGFDPRGIRDRYVNYFENNRKQALINRAYCIENPLHRVGFGENAWGISAGINSGGGIPEPAGENGTLCCSAALGAFPYTPAESMAALKHFYRDLGAKTWGIYGFFDGFNQTQDWYEPVWMALNQAQIVVMIENYRTGLVWKSFMKNPEIAPALSAMGFRPDPQVRR